MRMVRGTTGLEGFLFRPLEGGEGIGGREGGKERREGTEGGRDPSLLPLNERMCGDSRLYMVMMCRALSSCLLYSWILLTWQSNMEVGLIWIPHDSSR